MELRHLRLFSKGGGDLMPCQCQCANLDERWLCRACGHCWFATLTREGCPNCGVDIEQIDMRNDLSDIQGRQA